MDPSGVLVGQRSARSRRHPGWPAEVGPLDSSAGAVSLRPLRRRDGAPWRRIRIRDQRLIEQWDATSPLTWAARHSRHMWRIHYRALVGAARHGRCLPFAITVDDAFVGQMTVGGIERGPQSSGWVGYWVDSEWQRRSVASTALALAIAYVLGPVGIHRLEATISPANHASLAVVRHVGMREEGLLERYLDICGAWRDHVLYAVTAEELPAVARGGGVVAVARGLLDRL